MDAVLAPLSPMDVRWAHACNTRRLLDEAIARRVHFVEADICHDRQGAFMAHAPADVARAARAEASFAAWLSYALASRPDLGLKLDFKAPTAVPECIGALVGAGAGASCRPIWLNADLLRGPRGGRPAFDVPAFVAQCARVDGAVLSIGWTTGSPAPPPAVLGYTPAMVDEMLELCASAGLHDRPVTFPVRACDARAAPAPLRRLVERSARWSLTIWSGPEGADDDHERSLRRMFDPDRTFLDLRPAAATAAAAPH